MEIRAFIAIELPEEVKVELERLKERLKLKRQPTVKVVGGEAIHLTLKFLGNVAMEKIEAIKAEMSEVAKSASGFQLELKGVGCFPNTQRPRVIWAGLEGDVDALSRFQERLESALQKLGFPPENRAFSAHLTLGRVRDRSSPAEVRQIGETVQALDYKPALKFTAREISLIQSILKPQEPEYTTLFRVGLGPGT